MGWHPFASRALSSSVASTSGAPLRLSDCVIGLRPKNSHRIGCEDIADMILAFSQCPVGRDRVQSVIAFVQRHSLA